MNGSLFLFKFQESFSRGGSTSAVLGASDTGPSLASVHSVCNSGASKLSLRSCNDRVKAKMVFPEGA